MVKRSCGTVLDALTEKRKRDLVEYTLMEFPGYLDKIADLGYSDDKVLTDIRHAQRICADKEIGQDLFDDGRDSYLQNTAAIEARYEYKLKFPPSREIINLYGAVEGCLQDIVQDKGKTFNEEIGLLRAVREEQLGIIKQRNNLARAFFGSNYRENISDDAKRYAIIRKIFPSGPQEYVQFMKKKTFMDEGVIYFKNIDEQGQFLDNLYSLIAESKSSIKDINLAYKLVSENLISIKQFHTLLADYATESVIKNLKPHIKSPIEPQIEEDVLHELEMHLEKSWKVFKQFGKISEKFLEEEAKIIYG